MLFFIIRAKNLAKWSGTVIPIPILEEAVTAIHRSKLAGAYYYFGKLEFSRLKMIFSSKEIKKEKNSDVVVIFDSTVPFVGLAAPPPCWSEPTDPIGEASDLVSSPVLGNFATTRRKLFAEEYLNLDNESTNSTAPILYVPDRNGASRPKPTTSARSTPRAIPAALPHRSSCGSMSPNNWWRNNRK
ncbi:hypothetical protein AAHA92_00991 [Salvia divinorum]|uniref:Uncharacterized protein n=1 Tax=Salvia divinorum TaxID=28513 RepID=A0ABD1ILE8_SALDI